jgi:transposase
MGFMDAIFNSKKCIGIDVSKDSLDVADSIGDMAFQFENDIKGWVKLSRHLRKISPSLIVFEASGGYQDGPVQYLYKQNICDVSVVNPKNVRDFARAQGILAKTDRLDAKVLVRFGQVMNPRVWAPKNVEVEELEFLVKRREQLVQMQSVEKTRLASASNIGITKSIEAHLQYLSIEILDLQKNIQSIMKKGELKQKSELLQTMSGIGPTIASVLLTRLPELGELESKPLAAIVGLAPYSWDSGRLRGQRHIKGGRSDVRTMLYMATVSAIKNNPCIKRFYRRLTEAGKPPKVAMTACMRKMLIQLNAMLRDKKPFRMQHEEIEGIKI